MSQKSNQPVRERSAKLKAVIDLVKEEISKGKSSADIDRTIKKYHLTREEEAELIKDTFDYQVASEMKNVDRQNIITRLMIGAFVFIVGLIFIFMTYASGSIIFYLSFAIVAVGAWYVFNGIKDYKSL